MERNQRLDAAFLEHLQDREEPGLGDQCVKNRLDQQQVGATVKQALCLFVVRGGNFVKRRAPRRGIVRVGRDGRGLVRGTKRTGDKTHPAQVRRHHRVRRVAGTSRGSEVYFVSQRFEAVIGQRER